MLCLITCWFQVNIISSFFKLGYTIISFQLLNADEIVFEKLGYHLASYEINKILYIIIMPDFRQT